jgi:hypothetical protein
VGVKNCTLPQVSQRRAWTVNLRRPNTQGLSLNWSAQPTSPQVKIVPLQM